MRVWRLRLFAVPLLCCRLGWATADVTQSTAAIPASTIPASLSTTAIAIAAAISIALATTITVALATASPSEGKL